MSAATGFLFAPVSCVGCRACEVACSIENDLGWGHSWRSVHTAERETGREHLSMACNHCDQAPCASQCPAGAIRRDASTGAMLVDARTCIGCRYCAWVCPFGAPRFDGATGVMHKCTSCAHRLADGGVPACVSACPTDALRFGPLEGELASSLLPDSDAGPRLRFRSAPRPALRTSEEPDFDWPAPDPSGEIPRLGLGREWPLWLLTSCTSVVVGLELAGSTVGVGGAAALVAAMGLSSTHLGRPARAWRAIRNLRRSWLSREIVGIAGLALLLALGTWIELGPLAGAWGVLTVLVVDRVYAPVRPVGARVHPGQAWAVTVVVLASARVSPGAVPLGIAIGLLARADYYRRLWIRGPWDRVRAASRWLARESA